MKKEDNTLTASSLSPAIKLCGMKLQLTVTRTLDTALEANKFMHLYNEKAHDAIFKTTTWSLTSLCSLWDWIEPPLPYGEMSGDGMSTKVCDHGVTRPRD